MIWPESNEKLRELKRKWDEGYFGLDSAGVYPAEEALKEASEHLSMYDRKGSRSTSPKGIFGWKGTESPQAGNNEISQELVRRRDADRRYTDSSDSYLDRKFGHKICCVCNKKARNNPCDTCYRMVRDAAEWTDKQCTMEVYPCAMCGDEVYSTICGTCMDIMLSGA